ncbi:unnamed protein product, partial [Prunus brigantina]
MAKHPRMILYLDKVQELLKAFPTITIQHVPRAENAYADALASLGSALDTQFRRSIPVEHLDRPSIEEVEPIDTMQINKDPSWQDPIIDYLVNGNLPTDKSEARKVQQKAARYYMHGSKLIRRSYSGPHLTSIKYPQTLEVLCKIHDGECGNHSGGSVLRETQGICLQNTTVAHKQRPKGDAGRRPKRPSGDAAHKKRPKGDAGCARNFLKGGLHAFCGKYPGSYPFPKGGRIVTQLPISSVLRETQGDDQSVLRETQ